MDVVGGYNSLVNSESPNLRLAAPTHHELEAIHRLSFAEWGGSLTLPQFLEESECLTKVPLARNKGMESWILTDSTQPADQRPILCSCETFRKRSFVNDRKGRLSEKMLYGIASVFVNPEYRSRGYGKRMMRELAKALPTWHVDPLQSAGSILYSDIGKEYYTKIGWRAFPVNSHVELAPSVVPSMLLDQVREVSNEDLSQLCHDDETMARASLTQDSLGKTSVMVVPDVDHMLWHISKEEFACRKIFGRVPPAKGAIAGSSAEVNRVWAVWAHRYYSHPDQAEGDNTLYILRIVVENRRPTAEQMETQVGHLRAVLQAAQKEALEWKLDCIKLWHPIIFGSGADRAVRLEVWICRA